VLNVSPLRSGAKFSKLQALHARTGHYGICILVRNNSSINADPIVVQTGRIDEFFEDSTKKPFLQLLEELDAWMTSGLKGKLFSVLLMIRFIEYLQVLQRVKRISKIARSIVGISSSGTSVST